VTTRGAVISHCYDAAEMLPLPVDLRCCLATWWVQVLFAGRSWGVS